MRAIDAIDALFEAWKSALASKNVEALVAMVTEDAEFWSNAAPPLVGRKAVRAVLNTFLAQYDHRQEFDRLEILVAPDLAFVRGIEHNYIRPVGGGPETRHLQRAFMVIRREPNSGWRFARGMTNLLPAEEPSSQGAPE
jgi:uncharacterized protein (TIGR02246 family)